MKRFTPLLLIVVAAGCGTDVSGPSATLLSCAYGDALTLAPGSVFQNRSADEPGVCLKADSSAVLVYIPFFGHATSGDSAAELSVDMTGAGFSDPNTVDFALTVGPDPITLGTVPARGYRIDWDAHDAFRRRERAELEPRIRPGAVSPVRMEDGTAASTALDVPTLGELRDFNTATSCEGGGVRTGEVVYVSDHAVVYADTSNPADLSSDDYAIFGAAFDTLVYPVETSHFGTPSDIDGNGRSILFFTRSVNERNAAGSPSVVIGFFWSGDLFPPEGSDRLQACEASNESEMFYLIAPDPDGDAGVPFPLETVRELAIPLIGHEFQHLINASRRLFVNNATAFEEGWLNEGLSHAAEELLFFQVAGLQAGQNYGIDALRGGGAVDAFNQYMVGNFNNYARYLGRPDTASLRANPNKLTTRGAAWAFLRYAADRSGRSDEEFFFDVVNGTDAGVANLDEVVDGSSLDWIRDWTVAIYTDDFVSGVDDRFTQSTWDWRSVYEGSTLGTYPLLVRDMFSGHTFSTELISGAATYHRFGIAAGDRATLHVEVDGSTPPPALRGSFVRVR